MSLVTCKIFVILLLFFTVFIMSSLCFCFFFYAKEPSKPDLHTLKVQRHTLVSSYFSEHHRGVLTTIDDGELFPNFSAVQVWPVSCSLGATIGYLTGLVVAPAWIHYHRKQLTYKCK